MRTIRPVGVKETDFLCLNNPGGFNRPPSQDGKCSQAPGVFIYYSLLKKYAKSMRMNPTSEEQTMRMFLKENNIPYRRQKIIPPYIVDFLLYEKGLIIEVDGLHHENNISQFSYDTNRDILIMNIGLIVYRIKNSDIKKNINKILGIYNLMPRIYRNKRHFLKAICAYTNEYIKYKNPNIAIIRFMRFFKSNLKRRIRYIFWKYKKREHYIYKAFKPLILTLSIMILLYTPCHAETLVASFYSIQSLKNEGTYKYSKGVMANGDLFSDDGATCAINGLPFGTRLRVTNRLNGRNVVVVVTDRMARRFTGKRIDLAVSQMRLLDGVQRGIIPVQVEKAR